MSANRSSAGERSHRALIPHANFRKREPLVPSPFRGPPLVPRSSASFASCSSTTVITRYIAFRTNRYPPAMGNAPIEASAGKISKFPSECINRPDIGLLRRNIIFHVARPKYFQRATDCVYLSFFFTRPFRVPVCYLIISELINMGRGGIIQEKIALNFVHTKERSA